MNIRPTIRSQKIHSKRVIDHAVTPTVSIILILFLVVALAGIIYALIFGLASSVEKTAYVATDANIVNITPGIQAIEVMHQNGDVMYYENQSPDAQYEVRFIIDSGDSSSVVQTDPSLLSTGSIWSPGKKVIIFKRTDGYYLTDNTSLITNPEAFPPGPVGIRVIDNTHDQLIAYKGTGNIGGTLTPTTEPTTEPTTPPTTEPTTEPTTLPTTPTISPTPTPPPSQSCINCPLGESFSVAFTTEIIGPRTIRFKDASSPQPNIRAWTFGDGGSDTGEIVVHTYSTSGPYKITLTVKKNNSPCTCTLTQWTTVS